MPRAAPLRWWNRRDSRRRAWCPSPSPFSVPGFQLGRARLQRRERDSRLPRLEHHSISMATEKREEWSFFRAVGCLSQAPPDHFLGDLDRVCGGAFAKVVGYFPEPQAVTLQILPD